MQSHRRNIEKRFYKEGDVIKLPEVKRVKKGVYANIKRSFRISLIENGIFYGTYLD